MPPYRPPVGAGLRVGVGVAVGAGVAVGVGVAVGAGVGGIVVGVAVGGTGVTNSICTTTTSGVAVARGGSVGVGG